MRAWAGCGLITATGVWAAAAPAAHAALAGAQPLAATDRPNLETVTLGPVEDSATFCFDRALDSSKVAQTGFSLDGYDTDRALASVQAFTEAGRTDCVRAVFPSGSDLAHRTIGTTAPGAVREAGGTVPKASLGDSTGLASLQGTQPGDVVGPNVVSVSADQGANTLRIKYDRQLDPGSVAAGGFHYYDRAGNDVASDAAHLVAMPGDLVVAHFPAGANRSVADAVRFYAVDGAVTDLDARGSLQASAGVTRAGVTTDGETARPDLVSAVVSGPTSVDFTFDDPVQVTSAGSFFIHGPTAAIRAGQQATVLNLDARVVRVWFGPDSADLIRDGQIVADAFAGAVAANDSGALANSVGSAPIGSLPASSSFTAAPDAVTLTRDKGAGTLTVTFDQALAATPAGGFTVYDRSGNPSPVVPAVVAGGRGDRSVTLLVGSDVAENASGVGLDPGAVAGVQGDAGVRQLLAISPAGATPATIGDPVGGPPAAPAPSPAGGAGTTAAAPSQGSPATGGAATGPAKGAGTPRSGSGAKVVHAARLSVRSVRLARVHGRPVIRLRVTGKAHRARVRITVYSKRMRAVRHVVRTVRTNRTVTIGGVRLAAGQRVGVRVVS